MAQRTETEEATPARMLEPTDVPVRTSAPARRHRDRGIAGGSALAASTTLSNAFAAILVVVLAHSYTGGTFGALAALLGVALIATLPATGLQYVVARRTARADLPPRVYDATMLRWAALLGLGVAAVVVAMAPLLSSFLDVPVAAVLFVGASVVPYMINCAQLGSLLGQSELSRLAVAQLFLAGSRLAAVIVAGTRHQGVTSVMAWLFVASCASVVFCAAVTGLRTWTARLPADGDLARELVGATLTLAGISVLINLDILLARHYLSADDSGAYALAALFAKAALWSAQFVPQLVFSKLAREDGSRDALRRAALADVAVSAAVVVLAMTMARPVLDVVSRDPLVPTAARLAPLFAILGAGWALCYLVLLSSIATRNGVAGRMLWFTLLAESAVIAVGWHHSPAQIVAICAAGSLALGIAATAMALRAASPAVPRSVLGDAVSAG